MTNSSKKELAEKLYDFLYNDQAEKYTDEEITKVASYFYNFMRKKIKNKVTK